MDENFILKNGAVELSKVIPTLKDDPCFKVLSLPTDDYNCIAWAMQCEDRWVDFYEGHWWPMGVAADDSKQSLIDAFVAVGFEETEGYGIENGYDKVVLYEKDGKWTHASRIVDKDTEYSKFGRSYDATHGHNMFENSSYGIPYAIMKRKKEVKTPALMLGTIEVNIDGFIL